MYGIYVLPNIHGIYFNIKVVTPPHLVIIVIISGTLENLCAFLFHLLLAIVLSGHQKPTFWFWL